MSARPVAGQVMCADALEVLRAVPPCAADLVYLDPPFNTGQERTGTNGSFADLWPDRTAYLAFLRPVIRAARRTLRPTGSILLHCDWRSCHHARRMLDATFGESNFVNHLIWSYGLGGSSPRRFARKHDDILFYGRTEAYWFDPPRVPATSQRLRGRLKKATDVLEVPSINNMALERTGYPTQKPLALLEMLVRACAPPDGLVIDPMCGSGTALVAAARCARRYLGADVNPDAVRIARQRLAAEAQQAARRGALGVRCGSAPGLDAAASRG